MGKTYLLDTNIAIYLLNGTLPINAETYLRPILEETCHLSIVAKIELLGWNFSLAEDEHKAQAFIADSTILSLSDAIATRTIELRKHKKLRLGDAIIAATAIVHDMILLTRNEADFSNLSDLKVINPFTQ